MNTGKAETHWLSEDEVRATALTNTALLGKSAFEDDQQAASTTAYCAELMRSLLWALSGRGAEPVTRTRLVNAAAESLLPHLADVEGQLDRSLADDHDWLIDHEDNDEPEDVSPQHDKVVMAFARQMLDQLENLGDLARLSGGYLLPAPLRLVSFTSIQSALVLGGCPTGELMTELGKAIRSRGIARVLPTPDVGERLRLMQQGSDDWAGAPREPLANWTTQILRDTPLQPFDEDAAETTLEFYAPGQAKGRGARSFQHQRWIPKSSALKNGRYLARHASSGPMRFYVVDIVKRQVTGIGTLDHLFQEPRRLMYGLDVLANAPVSVEVRRGKGTAPWSFVLRSEVPRAERKLCMALGQLQIPSGDAYYPRIWRFNEEFVPEIMMQLRRLGVSTAEPR